MDVLAALLPPVVVAAAFIALIVTMMRHTDWTPSSRREAMENEDDIADDSRNVADDITEAPRDDRPRNG